MTRRVPVIGLTGGIGSGKSVVADAFADLGAAIIDTDVIAHRLTGPGGEAMRPIEAAFGADVVAADGRLDRAVMRAQVFADPAARQRLEAILHPLIRAASDAEVAAAQRDPTVPYVILVVPLLVESGSYRQRVEQVVVVDCDEATQLARVMQRSALPRAEVERIMAAQATRAERLAVADAVIRNDGDLAATRQQVKALDRMFRLKSSE